MKCPLCSDFKDRGGAIYENERFTVIADASPITPGHLLINTREHTKSYAYSDRETLHQLRTEIATVAKLQKHALYASSTLFFEHGNNATKTHHSPSVDHAHVHAVPVYHAIPTWNFIHGFVASEQQSSRTWNITKIQSYEPVGSTVVPSTLTLTRVQDITLQTYEQNIEKFVKDSPQVVIGANKSWIDTFLQYIPHGSVVYEFASGTGKDADYMERKGLVVKRSEAVHGFIQYQKRSGHEVEWFNLAKHPLEQHTYGAYFANGLLLHFTKEQCVAMIQKIHRSLPDQGIFAFSVKHGIGEAIHLHKLGSPRYYCYWNEKDLRVVLEEIGFTVLFMRTSDDDYNSSRYRVWIHVIVQKRNQHDILSGIETLKLASNFSAFQHIQALQDTNYAWWYENNHLTVVTSPQLFPRQMLRRSLQVFSTGEPGYTWDMKDKEAARAMTVLLQNELKK